MSKTTKLEEIREEIREARINRNYVGLGALATFASFFFWPASEEYNWARYISFGLGVVSSALAYIENKKVIRLEETLRKELEEYRRQFY